MHARMTMMGMEQILNLSSKSISDKWILTNQKFDKDTLMATIVMKGGTFEPLYTDPNYFYMMSEYWWKKHKSTFQSWWDVFDIDYAPLENYDRHEIIHEDTNDVGTLDSATTSRQVLDQDTTGTKSSHATNVLDSDTTGSENTTGMEVTDEDTTGTSSNRKVTDINRTHADTESTSGREVTDDDSTLKKTGTDTTVTGTTGLTATRSPGTTHDSIPAGSNSSTTTHEVSAFDSNSYEPSDRTSTTTNVSTDVYTDSNVSSTVTHNTTDTGTDDKTVTTTGSKETNGSDTEDAVETNDGTTSGTVDKSVNTTGTKTTSGTEDATTTIDSRDSESGTLDATTNTTGSVDQDTTNVRDFDRNAWIHGNIGVKTTQSMLLEELQVRAWNIYEHMADIFVDELCVRVY